MKFGVGMFPTDTSIRPDTLARAVEERGYESLFFPEHTHIPATEASREQTADLPEHYYRTLDLFVSMALAANATSDLLIASGICLLPQHEPIVAAKAIASIDHLSGGRVLFGIGAGWINDELTNFGFEPEERWAVMKDRMLTMQEIWTNDVAAYQGRYREFGPIYSWPKPVHAGGPPVLVGGNGPNVLKRVVDYGDGWLPNDRLSIEELAGRLHDLEALAASKGRGHLPTTIFFVRQEAEHLRGLRDLGIERVVFYLPSADDDTILAKLDELVALRDSLN